MEKIKNLRENLIKEPPAPSMSKEHKQKKVKEAPKKNWTILSQPLFHFGMNKAIFQMQLIKINLLGCSDNEEPKDSFIKQNYCKILN